MKINRDLSHSRRWLLIILLAAVLLRLAYLGSKSVWLDEAFAVWQAELSPSEIWSGLNDNHPPMYYLLLKAWMVFGNSETVIRLPSVFVSLMGLALFFILSSRLLNRKAALVAVALLAFAPLDLWYAQEARMVIFVIPGALLIALGLHRMGWKGAMLITVGLTLGLYFDYTIIPLWIFLSGVWFVKWWADGRHLRQLGLWFLASVTAWIIFSPLWSHLLLVGRRMSGIFFFENVREIINAPGFGLALPVIGLALIAAATVVTAHFLPKMIDSSRIGPLLALSSILLFALATLLMPIPRLYSLKRLVVTAWPFLILIVVWIAHNKMPKQERVLAVMVAASLAASLVNVLVVPKDDWRNAVSTINHYSKAGDAVWLDPFSGNLPYNYYQPHLEPQFTPEMLESPPDTDIWHIAERQPNRPIPGSDAELWLDRNRELLEVFPLYRLEVRHYASGN